MFSLALIGTVTHAAVVEPVGSSGYNGALGVICGASGDDCKLVLFASLSSSGGPV